jgi:hypothetical protein
MTEQRNRDREDCSITYRVAVSAEIDRKLRALAQLHGYPSPSAYLRFLALEMDNRRGAPLSVLASVLPVTSESTGHQPATDAGPDTVGRVAESVRAIIQQDNASIREALADFETGIQSSLRQSAATNREALIYLNALVQASVRQSTAAHYVSIMVWRLLAHKAELPAQGLPQHMRDEISRLHNRVFDAALTELRG